MEPEESRTPWVVFDRCQAETSLAELLMDDLEIGPLECDRELGTMSAIDRCSALVGNAEARGVGEGELYQPSGVEQHGQLEIVAVEADGLRPVLAVEDCVR